MSKRSKRVTGVTASVLALAVVLGGTALASKTKIYPTVTISAHQVGHSHKVSVSGVYDNKSHLCKGPKGRPVSVLASNKQGTSTTTGAGGAYSATFGHFNFRDRAGFPSYGINVLVPGSVRGGYGKAVVCYDATNFVKVQFHKKHHKKHKT
jgi:hypothetical protein